MRKGSTRPKRNEGIRTPRFPFVKGARGAVSSGVKPYRQPFAKKK